MAATPKVSEGLRFQPLDEIPVFVSLLLLFLQTCVVCFSFAIVIGALHKLRIGNECFIVTNALNRAWFSPSPCARFVCACLPSNLVLCICVHDSCMNVQHGVPLQSRSAWTMRSTSRRVYMPRPRRRTKTLLGFTTIFTRYP